MPKRSERDRFDPKVFASNPFEGKTPIAVYKALRWGNRARQTFSVNAPEPLVSLGEVAKLRFSRCGTLKFTEENGPFLAIGCTTNLVYFVPRKNGKPVNVPKGPYHFVDTLKRTDYYSDKGGDDAYYYHDHERPYPSVFQNKASGVCILVPAQHRGQRSYAVAVEGIVG